MGRLARARLGGCGPSFCGAVGGLDVVWLQPRSWSGAGRCGGCWACVVPARCLSCPACAGSTAGTNGARVARAGVPGPSQRRTTLCAQMRCGARAEPAPSAAAKPEASGAIRRRDDALGTTGASPSRPPRRRLLCAVQSASQQPNQAVRDAAAEVTAVRDRCRSDAPRPRGSHRMARRLHSSKRMGSERPLHGPRRAQARRRVPRL